jgi:aerobic-type carbon monoxide dehydrogenase small subunit (CoxS/CutS family)
MPDITPLPPAEGLHPTVEIRATVNGQTVVRSVPIHYRLIDFVREELKLTGNKEGCGAGECGTCSMFVDGKLVKSCLTPVQKVQGAVIETVDDLDRDHGMTVLQRAFHKCGASQCGYCIPGMVMAATSTLRRNPQASLDEIKQGLGGNICRCTGYTKILDAVQLARDVLNGTVPASALDEVTATSFIGHATRRLDAPGKVTGAARYAADLWMANMLHLQVLRSPHPHARIVRIDADAARALPGVRCVLTCDDVPGVDNFGVFIEDQPVMARGVVRYVGEAVLAVAADTLDIARAALRSVRVDYEVLPVLDDPHAAMAAGAVQLHAHAPGNICKHTKIRKGDVEAGLAEADLVVEQTYQTAAIEHAYLEPEAGLAFVEADGTVTVHSPSQNITHHRHMLAKILGRPVHKVRMVMSTVGGGFGGKEDMLYQGMLALAAIRTRRPVRYVFTREESFIASAKRHPIQCALHDGSQARRPHHRHQDGDGVRRRRLRHVHARRDEQVGHPGPRPLRRAQCLGRRHRRVHQQHAQRRDACIRRLPERVRHRGPPGPVCRAPGHGPGGAAHGQPDARRRHDPHPPGAGSRAGRRLSAGRRAGRRLGRRCAAPPGSGAGRAHRHRWAGHARALHPGTGACAGAHPRHRRAGQVGDDA